MLCSISLDRTTIMKLIHLNPANLPDWSTMFSQIVIAEDVSVRLIVLSGQVGVQANQTIAGDGSFEAQVEQTFANLQTALSAAKCSVADVMKLTIYVVDYQPGKVIPIKEAIQRSENAAHVDGKWPLDNPPGNVI